MQMRDSVIIIFGEERSHGDNVLRIVVLDGMEIAKLSLSVCIVIDNIIKFPPLQNRAFADIKLC